MKNRFSILLSAAILCVSGCNDDFLNVDPQDRYSEAAVWKDPAYVQSFVNGIYTGIPFPFGTLMLSSAVDESMAVWDWETSQITLGDVSPSYYASFDANFWTGTLRDMVWNPMYKNVRACNLFFEKIDGVPFTDDDQKNYLIGQVTFLRAYFYHQLVSFYGGVPLITKAYDVDDDFSIARSSYSDCIDFIVAELDKAATLLENSDNKAYATKGAALALKSRVLLYSASDLYNTNASWTGGYAHPELVSHTSGTRDQRWVAARDAAQAVIDLGSYSLYGGENPASAQAATDNFVGLFLNNGSEEDIFLQFFDITHATEWNVPHPGLFNGPNGWHNWGGNTPVGQLVDDFEMINGDKFDWTNPVHSANPYQNRDPRLYATVLHEGSLWRERPSDVVAADRIGMIQVGNYKRDDNTIVPGLDTRSGPIEDWNGSYTGYYLRKFIDPSIDHQFNKQEWPFRRIRYAEIILNLVEASIELGDEATAKTWLNKIRSRAGMPPITDTGDQLRQRYRNERRVELAYEEHRFYDVRRWMIAPSAYQNGRGVFVNGDISANNIISNRTYAVNPSAQQRAWATSNAFYFFPIRLDEINKNSLLHQNPKY